MPISSDIRLEGHAIVSADGMIADAAGEVPPALRNEADWKQYQAALDHVVLVVTGRRGHERFPNPGRRRLVLTRSVTLPTADTDDPLATLWNPAHLGFSEILAALGVTAGTVAITGVFDYFLVGYTHFQLSESNRLVMPGGTPCFAGGHPRHVLAGQGLLPGRPELIDPEAMVTSTLWSRPPPSLDSEPANS